MGTGGASRKARSALRFFLIDFRCRLIYLFKSKNFHFLQNKGVFMKRLPFILLEGSIEQAKMRAASPSVDFSFDFQDLLLKPVQNNRGE